MLRRAVFLDLNGTLVEPVLVDRLDDLRCVSGAAEAVGRLCRAGFVCPVVTVQSRIEKGYFTEKEFRRWFRRLSESMEAEGAHLEGPYVCPHRFGTGCSCAKPQPTLYRRAASDLGIDLVRSFTIGDTSADVEAATRFGGVGCRVSDDPSEPGRSSDAAIVSPSLVSIAKWIVQIGIEGSNTPNMQRERT